MKHRKRLALPFGHEADRSRPSHLHKILIKQPAKDGKGDHKLLNSWRTCA